MRAQATLVLIAASAALMLTGCTPAVSAHPPVTHAQTPTSSPAGAAGTPFACADLAAHADLDAIGPDLALIPVGEYWIAPPSADPWSASRVSLTQGINPPSSPTVVAAFERGFFGCYWADRVEGTSLQVSALPDAARAYNDYVGASAGGYELRAYDSLGVATTSTGGCGSASDSGPYCRIDALAGTTWIAVIAPVTAAAAGSDAIRSALVDIAENTAAKIDSAKELVSARPLVTSRWDRVGDCTSIGSAVGSVQPGVGSFTRGDLDVTGAFDPLARAAVLSAHGFTCSENAASRSISVAVVTGADWLGPLAYTDATPVPAEFGGAEGLVSPRALCLNSDPNMCWAEGYVDHALVVVSGLGSAAADAEALVSLAAVSG
ncbi:hypothetical protein [Leifsonia sp. NPDC058230]|uniref:hypothetical protein n=1 Tax=Leifsonia sp. NPDC058230 TaxID=3346391 RepID=UPI0036DBDB21